MKDFLRLKEPAPPLPNCSLLFLLCAGFFILSQGVFAGLLGFKPGDTLPLRVQVKAVVLAWCFSLAPVLVSSRLEKDTARALGMTLSSFRLASILYGILLFVCAILIWVPLFLLYFKVLGFMGIERPPQPVYKVIASGISGGRPDWPLIFVVVFLIPFFEEIGFRGVFQGMLRKYMPQGMAVFFSASFFGLLHSPWPLVFPVFLLGVIFGAIREKTGSLWASMAAHMFSNGLAVAFSPVLIHVYD